MPPRRSRNSSGLATKGIQKTLSFSSKVTKPSTPSSFKDSKPSPLSQTISSKPELLDDISTGHVTAEAAIAQQTNIELSREKTAEELRAEKVTDAQIRKYWREREAERRARRVHQKGLSVDEKILRLFDMSSQYGPCIGIARMKRWFRANKLSLSPPIEVLAVLLKEEERAREEFDESKYAGQKVEQPGTTHQRAYVDELMSSNFVIGEA